MTLLTVLVTCMIAAGAPGADARRWPLGPPVPQVVRAFSPPAVPWGPGHRGVDLAARPGQPVHAAAPGRVAYAGRIAGRGVVTIAHGALRTTYLPVRPSVRPGGRVGAGTRIGALEGGTPHCPTPCLHWGLLRGGTYLDPLLLVRPQVRLLPQWQPMPKTESPPRRAPRSSHEMGLRDATTATGGAVTGLALAYTMSFLTRRFRFRSRNRPDGVVDLARERQVRRVRRTL
ncbi:murein hydrolase activator EnvC family protein [Spirillospora albida]|uniref:murein hydrolase activator EnvC family protein n=1 Tax=Spirillospora albida TaxID=58123 RepID=UPI000A008BF5|nr:M23 family metallopeptidase [Spirillospora albida]